MNVLRRFVSYNRNASAWIAKRLSQAFSNSNPSYHATMLKRIAEDIEAKHPKVIIEAGGVDRPLLTRSDAYKFVGLDIDERPKCAHLYDDFIVQSIENSFALRADMIVSYTLLEHVPDNKAAITSMFKGLQPGGVTHHYVPSGFHPYSLALRAIGPRLQKRLIPILRAGTEDVTGYPAFFHLCHPDGMSKAFWEAGFTDIDVQSFYRANDYFAFFTPLYVLDTLFENLCRWLSLRIFASGFVISASRPQEH